MGVLRKGSEQNSGKVSEKGDGSDRMIKKGFQARVCSRKKFRMGFR